ncbi:MAG TPA: efflux RND transporter periplasmic adaptor subunit [Pirellulaceae bacterium]|nr:efflux RND transporter periplasmic adaptor subunit [Pirellulaceae bacterium]
MAAVLVLLFAISTAIAQAPKGVKGGPPAQPAAKVFVEAVRVDTINAPRTFVGTVRPLRKSLVGSAAAGRVEEYLVNDGDFVQKGQPIAKLRTGIIQAEVNAAQAELRVRQAALAELETSFQDEIEQGQARLKLAEANRDYRRAKRDRALALGPAISKEVRDEDIALAAQAEASVLEAAAALRLLEGGPREQKTEQARARVEVQEAEVERFTEQLNRHTMFAPFDGYVTAEHAEIGQWVMQGDPVAEIIELTAVDVEFNVLEDYIGKLSTSVGGAVEILSARREPFEGMIAVINPQADDRARTFPVKVRVENTIEPSGPLIKAGMFARVTLPVGEPEAAPLVPKDAIVLGGATPVIYIVDQQGGKSVARPVTITLGITRGLWITVGGADLKPGALVVVEGNERLRPMQEVRPERVEVKY